MDRSLNEGSEKRRTKHAKRTFDQDLDNAERMRKYHRKKKDESDLQKQESKRKHKHNFKMRFKLFK